MLLDCNLFEIKSVTVFELCQQPSAQLVVTLNVLTRDAQYIHEVKNTSSDFLGATRGLHELHRNLNMVKMCLSDLFGLKTGLDELLTTFTWVKTTF